MSNPAIDVEGEIRSFIRENFILDGEGPGRDESLSGAAILDSMGVLELIMFVEERYAVKVADEDAVPANFDTISRIARYVTQWRATEGGADDLPAAYRVA
jgi:acyl carrier protein